MSTPEGGHGARRPVRIGLPVRLAADDPADPRVAVAKEVFESLAGLVAQTGADVVRIVPGTGLLVVLESCDGFVIPGGGDVDPDLYGGASDGTLFGVDPGKMPSTRRRSASGSTTHAHCSGSAAACSW
jgi:hypothetical protein